MLSPQHVIIAAILLAIALVIFGPGKLGDVGGALGKSVKEFRHSSKGDDDSGSEVNSTASGSTSSSTTTPNN